MPVEIVHFNPMRRRKGILGRFSPRVQLNNFGDMIGPMLVARIVEELGLEEPIQTRRLVAVGSIMKLTEPGDVVWGAGVNGKSMATGAAPELDVRAVRGPVTREILMQAGSTVPEVYGDPALLWSRFWPRGFYEITSEEGDFRPVAVVPNYNDAPATSGPAVIQPIGHPHDVIGKIARSDFVCGSSLHGIVVAEALGIPARLIKSQFEPSLKYDDYYAGTGRSSYSVANSVEEAVEMGGERPPIFDADALLGAFPADIYVRSEKGRG